MRGVGNLSIATYENTSYAAFSQFSYDLTPSLQITAGLRYTYERRQLDTQLIHAQGTPSGVPLVNVPGDPTTQLPVGIISEPQFDMLAGQIVALNYGNKLAGDADFERVSPMFSLSWTPSNQLNWEDNELMAYLTISEGFKGGGFDVSAARIRIFQPEYVVSTEIGFKLDAFQRSLRLNAAAYRSDYKDIQLLVAKIPALGAPEITTINAGLAEIQGYEAEITWLVNHAWSIRASGNIIDAKFLEFDDEGVDPATGQIVQVNRSKDPFPFIPEKVYSLTLRYGLTSDTLGDFDFMLSHNYRDGMYLGVDAGAAFFPEGSSIDGRSVQSLRVSWRPYQDDRLQLSLYGNNFLGKEYVASGWSVGSIGSTYAVPGKPAMFGIEVAYRM